MLTNESVVNRRQVAEKIQLDNLNGKAAWYSGNYNTAVEYFERALKNSYKLKTCQKRDEIVVQCKINLEVTKTCLGTLKAQGVHELEELVTALEKDKCRDNHLLTILHYNLARACPFDPNYVHVSASLRYLSEHCSHGHNSQLKEQILENLIEILNLSSNFAASDFATKRTSTGTPETGSVSSADSVIDVVPARESITSGSESNAEVTSNNVGTGSTRITSSGEKVVHTLLQAYAGCLNRCEQRLSRYAKLLMRLAYHHLQKEKPGIKDAERCATTCFVIFKQYEDHVTAAQWNDLGLIHTNVEHYSDARNCFQRALPYFMPMESAGAVTAAVFQNLGVICLLKHETAEAIHYFQDALCVLGGQKRSRRNSAQISPIPSTPPTPGLLNKRRAHLYLNLGLAWSRTGRENIWKTVEAFLNAAEFANKTKQEVLLRRDALYGLVMATMMVQCSHDSLDYFLSNVVFKNMQVPKEIQSDREFKERSDIQSVVKDTSTMNFASALANIKIYLLAND